MKTYQETLDFLYWRLPMFQKVGKSALKKDLDNILKLCHHLGHPHRRFSSVHIAGTNGKGSVSHFVAAILQKAGLRVGLYTSPHYHNFRERIKINGEYIAEDDVVDFVNRIKHLLPSIEPSFFEITVAMAFDYFCRQGVDIAVIETGLGGRLDSTNIIVPLLSVITNISFDHEDYLGDTLPKIAVEKAGIIKHGIPILIGTWQKETAPVFASTAKQLRSPLFFVQDLCQIEALSSGINSHQLRIEFKGGLDLEAFEVALNAPGPYQVENCQISIAAIQLLKNELSASLGIHEIREGLAEVRSLTSFIGRWQILGEGPLIIADSAHNEAGIKQAVSAILRAPVENIHMVFGVVKDKDLSKILSQLPARAKYYFCSANQPRALSAQLLQQAASKFGLKGKAFETVAMALVAAQNSAKSADLIFIGGSTFVTAEVLSN